MVTVFRVLDPDVPFMGELDFYYVDEWPQRKRRRAMDFYKECVRRQIVANGGGTHLSKRIPPSAGASKH